jgi:hypothetical protein
MMVFVKVVILAFQNQNVYMPGRRERERKREGR